MSKINVTPGEYADIVVCFLLDKMLHPDEVIPLNKDFNKYADKLTGKGMKSVSLNYYLNLNANLRVYYKRIKKVFEYDQNQSAVIQIWPSKKDKEKSAKKDNILKRAINKLLMKDDITEEERGILTEEYKDEEE